MNLRTIPRAAVGGYLKLLRLPVDTTLKALGRNGSGEVAVDRADAALRDIAGTALGDQELKQDAKRRRTAADAREEAAELRAEAQRKAEEADEKLDRKSTR